MPACNHNVNFPAIRAFNRVWNPINSSYDAACAADYGFDAGEFSGPAIGQMWEHDLNRVAALVAARYGMTPDVLVSQAFNCHPMHEQDILISKGLY